MVVVVCVCACGVLRWSGLPTCQPWWVPEEVSTYMAWLCSRQGLNFEISQKKGLGRAKSRILGQHMILTKMTLFTKTMLKTNV